LQVTSKSLPERLVQGGIIGFPNAVSHRYSRKINLVITDVVMPGMSGPKLAESIAAMHPQAKILFVSGCTEDAVLRKGAAELPRNFLLKPFSFESLAAKIREVLDEPERANATAAGT